MVVINGCFVSNTIRVEVGVKTDTTNVQGTSGETYLTYIPDNATITKYDPQSIGVITGLIKDKNDVPLSDVTVSFHNNPRYGSVKTDLDGRFIIASEAGPRKIVFRKSGYLTVHKEAAPAGNNWDPIADVVLIEQDSKITQIELGSDVPQIHTSSVVTDNFGSRSTTLIFNNINSATVQSPDGSSRSLGDFSVRATEYELPESMPGALPENSAFTYCSELQIPGVRDDETVVFDKPVIMYVDNFLNFNVGHIVPIGYYDRNIGDWVGSKDGAVVQLLDTDQDGLVDALDFTGDGIANDINNNGSIFDEAVGLESYQVGSVYWRGSLNHFTPWDFNWPFIVRQDAVVPETPLKLTNQESPYQCEAVSTASYVKPETGAFHEDIPIVGTDLTLHYSSQRTEGFKHEIKLKVTGNEIPNSLIDVRVILKIGGVRFQKLLTPEINKEVTFIWDGRDISGKYIYGVVKGQIRVGYSYEYSYSTAGLFESTLNDPLPISWNRVPDPNNISLDDSADSLGRNLLQQWNNSEIVLKNADKNQIANGWSISNHHISSANGTIYKGDGSVIDGEKSSFIPSTLITDSQIDFDDGYYQKGIEPGGYSISGEGVLRDNTTSLEWAYPYPATENNPFGTIITFGERQNAANYCARLDTANRNWRLPTYKELIYTIIKNGGDSDFPLFEYDALNFVNLSSLEFLEGNFPLICVSGESLNIRFFENLERNDTDEVVVDTSNNLMWQDDPAVVFSRRNFSSSIEYCENLDHAGFDDWRLPNINELAHVLPNFTMQNQTTIPNVPWDFRANYVKPYWSSTPNVLKKQTEAWAMESVSFTSFEFRKSESHYTRCVRDNLSSLKSPYRFNGGGRHNQTIDLNSGVTLTSFDYDTQNRLVSMTDRFGDKITLNRNFDTGKVTSISTQDGYVTNLTVDENKDLTRVDYPDGTYYQFIYDNNSLMTDEIDPNGNTFLHIFDENGRAIQTSDPEGGVWDFFSNTSNDGSVLFGYSTAENNTYQTVRSILESGDTQKITTDIYGTELTNIRQVDNLKETLESSGVTTVIDHVIDSKTKEEIPNKITITLPSGLQSITDVIKSYGENGTETTKQTLTINQNGKTSSVYSDSKTGVRTITSAEGRTSTLNSDPETLLLQSTQTPGLLDTTYAYDARGRQTTVTTGDRTTTYTYNDAISKGDVTTIAAADGKVTAFEYDAMGRVSKVTYPDGHSTENSYDDNGNLSTLVIPTPATHSFTHNSIDNVTSETTPLSEVTQYSYDRDRNLTQISLPSGDVINNTYTNGLLTRSATPEGDIDYSYESGAKVSSVTEGSESLSYNYDGNLLTSFSYAGVLDQTISQSYDTDFRITKLNYAGQATALAYDDDGLVTDFNNYVISRNTLNGLPEVLDDGTLQQNRSYNGYGEATSINTSVNGNGIYDFTLTYNSLGKITAKEETLDDGTINNYVYGYDDKRQLTSVTQNGTEVESYDYDSNGNRINQSNSLRGISNQSATYNLGDQLESNGDTTYEYDADGYLSKKISTTGTTSYQYSSQGRLLQVQTPSDTISYQHNALGNRVAKSVNGVIVVKYLWLDKTTLLATYDASDNLVQRFEYADGNTPSSFTQGGQTFYVVTDHLGTPRAITNSSGLVLKKISYDSFGNVLSDSNPAIIIPFGFAGGLQDVDTGLVRFGFRDYDPETGRWTARDPIGFAGGDSNLYGYVFSDPVNYNDPTGLIVPAVIGVIHIGRTVAPFIARMLASRTAKIAAVSANAALVGNGEIGGGFCSVTKSSAYNIANSSRLAQQLRLQSAKSSFTKSGKLTDEAIKNSREIIPSSAIKNPNIPKGFGKYSTETFQSPSGNFQTHFYKNSKTGEVFYGQDYKSKF